MNESSNPETLTNQRILEKLNDLESRITQLEHKWETNQRILNGSELSPVKIQQTVTSYQEDMVEVDEVVIESKIVEYGLAWLGSIVLLFGIVFLMSFTKNHLNGITSSLIAYTAVAGVFFLGWYLRHSFPHLSYMLKISGHLLVYYITLRFYFFSSPPIIPLKGVVILLMLIAIGFQIYFAIRTKSELLGAIAIILTLSTAMVSDQTHITLPLVTLGSITSLFLLLDTDGGIIL